MDGTSPRPPRVSRRWLLGAGVASTVYASSVTRPSVGAVVAGDNMGASDAVTEPGAGSRLRPLKPVGQNLASEQLEYYGQGFPFLDRAKTSSPWQVADWKAPAGATTPPAVPVNVYGYPTAIPAGAGALEQIVNVEGPFGPRDRQRYVFETTRTDATFAIPNQWIVSNAIVAGKRRIVFDVTHPWPFPPSAGYGIYLRITALPTPYAASDTHQLFRLDQEAALKGGALFSDAFIARVKDYGVFRFMDWDGTNHNDRAEFADRPPLEYTTWRVVPLEVQIALCNAADVPGHFCIMAKASDDHVRQLAAFIEARLKPGLRYLIEFSNEAWNYAFDAYHYLYNLAPAIPGNIGDPSNRQYGYRMARVAAIFRKASGYSNRVDVCWGTMFVDASKTQAHLIGIRRAIADWCDPAHRDHDADYAARFDEPGKLLNMLMPAGYIDGGLTYPASEAERPAFKATIRSWAAARDDSGLAKAFRQMEFGDQVAGTRGWLNAYAGTFDAHRRIAEPLGIRLGQYEGGYHLDADKSWPNGDPDQALVTDFFTRLSYDPRSYHIYTRLFALARSLGSQIFVHLCDQGSFGNAGGIWGTIRDGYHPDTPRARAIVDFNAAPPAPPPLTVSVTTDGDFNVGSAPVTRIVARGGVGRITVTCTGLAPGRRFDGFRRIDGRLIATGTTVGTIIATDEIGATARLVLDQAVAAAKPSIAARSLRLVFTESAGNGRNFVIQLREIKVRTAAGDIVPVTWSGPTTPSLYAKSEVPAHLSDGDPNSRWTSPTIAENRQPIVLRGDFAALTRIATIGIVPADPGGAPGSFKIYASDGKTSRMVLSVDEPDARGWPVGVVRNFALAEPRS